VAADLRRGQLAFGEANRDHRPERTNHRRHRPSNQTMNSFTNVTFDEIRVGQTVSATRTLSRSDIEALAFISGDIDAYEAASGVASGKELSTEAVAATAFVTHLLNRKLPGPGTSVLSHQLRFEGQLAIGDTLTATVTARDKQIDGHRVLFDFTCVNQAGQTVASGSAVVAAPTTRLSYEDLQTPEVIFRRTDDFARLIKSCHGKVPVSCAVVHPCDQDSLLGPIEAARRGLITPVLVGPEARIRQVAEAAGVDLSPYRVVTTEHSHAAAEKAVALARAGEVESLMKGSLHTEELLAAIVPSATGLRTARRISHVFVMDVPSYPRLLLVTDAGINIQPTLKDKVDIVQNAIDLAHVLGIAEPKVALLSAVETVNPDIPSTLDAAALCKMADRKQITGGLLDGPLAFDNAVSEHAATVKKIESNVAGQADVLVVPDLESGNMVAKQLQYLAGADAAGIVLGARVPIVLTSRADTVRTRLASTAVMSLLANARRQASANVLPRS
jgi:phosphate acetyltransferase